MNCIFVVEDEFDIQELLKNYLEEDKLSSVLAASDGVEAINLFEKEKEQNRSGPSGRDVAQD